MPDSTRAFISYARQDGEEFARGLRERLEREAPELTLWQDRARLEGGVGWWKQITDAIDSVQFLVLVMTPAALRSPIARKEWRYARQQGVCVYPVKSVPDETIDFDSLPRWMSKAHFFDLEREWETFLNYLKSPCQVSRVPFMVPDLPEDFVERVDVFKQLIDSVLDGEPGEAVAITTALHGAGGLGKTTLAKALCHDDDVITNFDDGILWVTLGKQPNVHQELTKLYAALTGERPGFVDSEDAALNLSQKLEDRHCLLVIDDVWDLAHLNPFMRGGKNSVRLITTRAFEVASDARRIEVDEMTGSEAVEMLTRHVDERPRDLAPFRELSERLDRWPLMLELAGATLNQRLARGDSVAGALEYLRKKLDKQGVVAFDSRDPVERHQAIAKTIEVSLELLEEAERDRLSELAIFPDGAGIPLSAIGALWALDDFDTEELVQRFGNLSLLMFSLQAGTVHLHDVIRAYLIDRLADSEALHAKLLDSWGDPYDLPDAYAWRWLPFHLVEGGRRDQLHGLLLDFEWLQAKLQATDVTALIGDYDYLPDDETLGLVQEALQLSAHVLAEDRVQLAGQLLGRLPVETSTEMSGLREGAEKWRGAPWLRPLTPLLAPPGGALLFTLAGHGGRVRAVALSSDGRRALSASDDGTVRVWELERGSEERVFEGHSDWVRAVETASASPLAISASDDHSLRIWNLESGREQLSIDVRSQWILTVAITPDGRYAITACDDRFLTLWDLERGVRERTLEGHTGRVNAVAVTPDGKHVLSASEDRTLRLWDLDTGAARITLTGHTAKVNAVAVSPDGRKAVSASSDDTLRIWDLENEAGAHRTLSASAYGVRNLAITPDGRRVITAADDYTLKIWSLESGDDEGTLEGHTNRVNAVAVAPDGGKAVSASDDHTLKIWDLQRLREEVATPSHSDRIRAVAIVPDGRRAVTTSDDHTLRIWDTGSRSVVRTVSDQHHWVFALTADGRNVVSASSQAGITVHDLETGTEVSSFSHHSDRIKAIVACPDGRRIVSAADDRTIRVWDLATGEQQLLIQIRYTWIRALAVDPQGKYLISASDRPALKVWSLQDGTELHTLRGHTARVNSVVFTPDGRRAVSASDDRTLRVWDLENGGERVLEGHRGRVNSLANARDGLNIVSTSHDRTTRIWSLESGELIATFSGESPVLACAVNSADGTILVGDHAGWLHFLRLEV